MSPDGPDPGPRGREGGGRVLTGGPRSPSLLALHKPQAERHSLQGSQVLGQSLGQLQGRAVPQGIAAEPARGKGGG